MWSPCNHSLIPRPPPQLFVACTASDKNSGRV